MSCCNQLTVVNNLKGLSYINVRLSCFLGLESEMEVRHITKKIADLNERLDATSTLAEPRENAFIKYLWQEQMHELVPAFSAFGKVRLECFLTWLLSFLFPLSASEYARIMGNWRGHA